MIWAINTKWGCSHLDVTKPIFTSGKGKDLPSNNHHSLSPRLNVRSHGPSYEFGLLSLPKCPGSWNWQRNNLIVTRQSTEPLVILSAPIDKVTKEWREAFNNYVDLLMCFWIIWIGNCDHFFQHFPILILNIIHGKKL